MKGDVSWLTKNLAQAVGWDEQSAEGVAEAIAAAGSRQEVDELAQVMHYAIKQQTEFESTATCSLCPLQGRRSIMLYSSQDYLGGTDKVQSIITQFLGETKVSTCIHTL